MKKHVDKILNDFILIMLRFAIFQHLHKLSVRSVKLINNREEAQKQAIFIGSNSNLQDHVENAPVEPDDTANRYPSRQHRFPSRYGWGGE